jgi:hypothetical protein
MIIAVIVLAVIVVYLMYNNYKEKNLFKKVKWCVYNDSFRKERPEVRMHDQIFHFQNELSLDEKYRITIHELDAINGILLHFRQDVIQEYFSSYYQKLGFSFENNLRDFLETHQDEYEFKNNITFHKLYYILQLYYLKLHNIVDDNKLGVIKAKAIKESIDDMLSK